LRIPTNSAQNIVLGPSLISQSPDPENSGTWAWARFTLTGDSLSLGENSWDGTGPNTGFAYGETEDIYFDSSTPPENHYLFVIKQIPERDTIRGSGQVGIKVSNIGDTVSSAVLRGEAVSCSGDGNPVTILTDSITFTNLPPGDTTVYFDVEFQDDPSNRICNVFWELSSEVSGTKLVATNVGMLEESSPPYFVFLNPLDEPISWVDSDTTISYYGGAIDLKLSVIDPDGDYPCNVKFHRGEFFDPDSAKYVPIFANSKFDSVAEVSSSDSTLNFYWAVDTADTGTWRAIFEVEDGDNPAWIRYDTLIIIVDTSKPDSNTIWVGRKGVIKYKGSRFSVPVEAYNDTSLSTIGLPFEISNGSIDTLLEISYVDSRLSDTTILKVRNYYPFDPPIADPGHFEVWLAGGSTLEKGFGKIFDLHFIGLDTTHFEIGRKGNMLFYPNGGVPITAKFETYIITVTTPKDFMCGDVNDDSKVDLSDPISLANYYFGKPCEINPSASDVNCDNLINLSDGITIANSYFGKPGFELNCCP